MNDDLQLDLEIVELGDAKEETKGAAFGMVTEDNPTLPYRKVS